MTISPPSSGQAGHILVVDDDDILRIFVASVLDSAGYQVTTAKDGAEALALFAESNCDCIVTDVNMPNMNGFELCAAVRIMPGGERVQVLFMTGLDDHESIQHAYEVGANDFSPNRISPALLVERVRFLFKAQRTQDALRFSEQRLAYAQRLARLGHWERTLSGETLAISPVVGTLLEVDNAASLNWGQLCELVHPDDLKLVQQTVNEAVAKHQPYRIEHRLLTKRGTLRVLRHQGEVVSGDTPGTWLIRSTVQDVTERRAQEDRIHFLAFHDPVTSLPNREFALRSLEQAIGNVNNDAKHIAVFALGLDDFSRINTSLGQAAGDDVLKIIGDRLRGQVRESDHVLQASELHDQETCLVARTEGDRFLCLVSNLQFSEAAISIAKRLQRTIAAPLKIGDTELTLSSTVGVSLYPDDGITANELVDRALIALSYAKGQKGTCQFFASEISDRARQRLTLENELRVALDEKQFVLHFQPRLGLHDYQVCGAEALVRWCHPQRGLVGPSEFIPLVEELGMISALGAQVVDMAARQATLWQRRFGAHFRVSFNISPLQFLSSDVVAELDAALARVQGRPDCLEVEVTESTLMSHPDKVIATLQAFRDRGVRVALDDFGTGYSSLSYLQRLPLDVLKIDRSFINDIGSSHSGTALVNAMLFIARALNLDCVAEGVELVSQLDFLAAHHCNEAQGFWIAKPMPAREFEVWHQQWVPMRSNEKIA